MSYFENIKVPHSDRTGVDYFWYRIAVSKSGRSYWIHTSGTVAVRYKNGKEKALSPYVKNDKLCVKIIDKEYCVKHLVAREVFSNYRKGMSVIHLDGDITNCDHYNLKVYTKRELGSMTGAKAKVNHKVSVDGKIYHSVRAAAKDLYVSYQTLLDYLNTGRSSVIDPSKKIFYI